MIRPQLALLTEVTQPGVRHLFDECDVPWMKEWQFNPQRTLVALHGGEVVGFVTSWWDNQPIAWIDLMLVTPDLRGTGIGAWLLWTMEAMLRQRGAKVVRVVLDGDDSTVQGQMTRCGYTICKGNIVMERHNEG